MSVRFLSGRLRALKMVRCCLILTDRLSIPIVTVIIRVSSNRRTAALTMYAGGLVNRSTDGELAIVGKRLANRIDDTDDQATTATHETAQNAGEVR